MATLDAQKVVDKMREMFGDMEDPDVFPRVFEYRAKMAMYELKLESEQHDKDSGQERNPSDNHS